MMRHFMRIRPVRLQIYAYAHLNVRYIDYNSVASFCAVNHDKIQYAQTGKDPGAGGGGGGGYSNFFPHT